MIPPRHSAIYEGTLSHVRGKPRHDFTYQLFMLLLDLDELPALFSGHPLWSAKRPALAWFRREDHLGDPRLPLRRAVADLVEERIGRRPDGPVRLLTHLRYFGYCINPISIYYCMSADDTRITALVLDVINSPWDERHVYVLDASEHAAGARIAVSFDKELHVSPFFDMEARYTFTSTPPGDRLGVTMAAHDTPDAYAGRPRFMATLRLRRREITDASLSILLVRQPLMTARVFAAIYWEAFRLWLKGTRYIPHPKYSSHD